MVPPCQANFYQEKFAQLIEAEVDRRLEAESELRIERERQVDYFSWHLLLEYMQHLTVCSVSVP